MTLEKAQKRVDIAEKIAMMMPHGSEEFSLARYFYGVCFAELLHVQFTAEPDTR